MKKKIRILLAGVAVSTVLPLASSFGQTNPSVKINDDAAAATQINPSVAINGFGYAVICWTDSRNGNNEIWAQVINERGARVLGNFRVFDDPSHTEQSFPAAAMDDHGRFLIVWQDGPDAAPDIRGRLFLANGQPAIDPFRINDEAAGVIHAEPVVAMRADGFFMVCWADSRDDSKLDIYGQRFDVSGNPIDGNFRINSETANEQNDAVIAMNSSGECLVVWEDKRGGGPIEIFGQKVDAAGAFVGGNFQINPSIEGSCWDPSVAMQNDGSFFVAWSHGIANEQVFGRAFDSLGVPAEQSVTVSSGVDASGNFHPHMSTAPAGRYSCVWTSMIDHGSNLWMRELDADGEPQGNLFKISDAPDPSQLMYSAADVDGRGIGIAAWSDTRSDESDIRATWFGPRMALDPVAGSGFDGIVPLSWSPIYGEAETRTVEIYRSPYRPVMFMEKIATLDLSTRPYPKRMLDWVDSNVSNDSTYCYRIRCAGDSRFSDAAYATPSSASHAMRSAWSGSPVLVDGILNADEWADAAGLSIGNPAAKEPITLYVKNDADSLFVGVDDPNDPLIDPANLFVFLFDEDNDGLWDPSGLVTEGAISLAPAGIGYTPYGGDYPESFQRGALEIPAGVKGAISANSGHVQYELAVSLKISPLQEEAGETIGVAFWINDPGSHYPGRYGYAVEWPSGALWDAARTLGRLTLAEETGVSGRSGGTPEVFQLGRNYPNPFNPSTTIPFRIKEACKVTLKVYDVLGKEKAVLIDGRFNEGSHTVLFNAAGLPSGIYMYRIQMGDFIAARKMVVLE